jgi:hypothetical protein
MNMPRFPRFRALVSLPLFVAVLGGACSTRVSGGTDSNTNFWLLPCTQDDECGGLTCLCGQCSRTCGANADCTNLAGGVCRPNVEHPSACGADTGGGACAVACGSNRDCESLGLTCVLGFCEDSAVAKDGGFAGASGSNQGGGGTTGGGTTGAGAATPLGGTAGGAGSSFGGPSGGGAGRAAGGIGGGAGSGAPGGKGGVGGVVGAPPSGGGAGTGAIGGTGGSVCVLPFGCESAAIQGMVNTTSEPLAFDVCCSGTCTATVLPPGKEAPCPCIPATFRCTPTGTGGAPSTGRAPNTGGASNTGDAAAPGGGANTSDAAVTGGTTGT